MRFGFGWIFLVIGAYINSGAQEFNMFPPGIYHPKKPPVETSKSTVINKNERKYSYKVEVKNEHDVVVTEGAKNIRKVFIGTGIHFFSFAYDPTSPQAILLGTDHGLYVYDKLTGKTISIFESVNKKPVTITQLETTSGSVMVWFSSLESGMGSYNQLSEAVHSYPFKAPASKLSIYAFARKSSDEFFIAAGDSVTGMVHESMGVKLCQSRLELEKTLNSSSVSVEIMDKYNGTIAAGTLVKLKIEL